MIKSFPTDVDMTLLISSERAQVGFFGEDSTYCVLSLLEKYGFFGDYEESTGVYLGGQKLNFDQMKVPLCNLGYAGGFAHIRIEGARYLKRERCLKLLSSIIDYTALGRNEAETINELLNMGFTGDELEEFGFDMFDIADVMEERDCDEE